MRKWLWRALGLLFVGFAYIGVITPGVPVTTFALLAAWAFSKSSPKLDKWLHEHPLLGKYLNNWEQKRVYPNKGRKMMVVVMCVSLVSMYFTVPLRIVGYAAFTFAMICIWAFRFPGSVEEYDRRVKQGKRIGWLKKTLILLMCASFTHNTSAQVKLDSNDLEEYVTRISGKFSTQYHQTIDSTKGNILVRTIVFKRYPTVVWLYTQQGEIADGKYYPYRQRIYAVEQVDEYHIQATIYGFKNDAIYSTVLDDTTSSLTPQQHLQNIPPELIVLKEGCSIRIHKDNLNAFRGSTNEGDCKGSFGGATYTTSEFVVYPHEVISWERGWDDSGKQKWGSTQSPYIYSKIQ